MKPKKPKRKPKRKPSHKKMLDWLQNNGFTGVYTKDGLKPLNSIKAIRAAMKAEEGK